MDIAVTYPGCIEPDQNLVRPYFTSVLMANEVVATNLELGLAPLGLQVESQDHAGPKPLLCRSGAAGGYHSCYYGKAERKAQF